MAYVENILDGIYGSGSSGDGTGLVGPISRDVTQEAISATRLEYTTVITDATGFSIGFEMPRGLGHIKDDGEMESHEVKISVYYKLSSAGTWTWAWTRTKTAATTSPQRWEEMGAEGLTAGEYDIAIVNHNQSSLDSNRYLDVLLVDYINAWPDGTYDFPNTAYYQFQIEQNEQTGNDRSEKSVLVEGFADCRIYTDTSTYTDGNYTNNPAWVWMALLTSDRFGFGYAYSDLDIQSFIDAASYFSTNSITWNPYLDGTQNGIDLKTRFQTECMCFVSSGGSGVKITPDTTGSSTYSFDNDNIVKDSLTISYTSIKNKVNRVIVEYADVNYNYKPRTMQRDNDDAIVDAGNHVRDAKMTLLGVVDRAQAEMIADRQLAWSNYVDVGCSFETGLQGLGVEVGDIIDITGGPASWSAKDFRVIEIAFNPHTNRHRLYCVEYNADIYGSHSWTAGGSDGDGEDTDAWVTASDVTGLALTQGSRTDSDGNTIIQFDVDWTNPVDSNFDHVAIWVLPSNEGNWRCAYVTPDDTVETWTYDDAREGVTYRVAVCSVSTDGVQNGYSESPQESLTITYSVTEENLTDRGGWDRANTFYTPDGGIQFGMLNPNHKDHYEFLVEGVLQDNANQSDGIAMWQVTGGIPYYTVWAASTEYSAGDWVVATDQDPDSPVYFKCTTAGTSDATEPTWDTTAGNTTNDGTVVWTCYTDSDGIDGLDMDRSVATFANTAGNAVRGEGMVMVLGGTATDWDYQWGPAPTGDPGTPFILYSKQGAPFQQFRILDYTAYAEIVEAEYDYVEDSGTYYGILKRVVVDRPIMELPSGNYHYVNESAYPCNDYPEFTARVFEAADGTLWTEFTTTESASTSNYAQSDTDLATLYSELGEPGDKLRIRHYVATSGGLIAFRSAAMVLVEGKPGMIARIDAMTSGGAISSEDVYLYTWETPAHRPVIKKLTFNGATDTTGLTMLRVAGSGGHTCVLMRSQYTDGDHYNEYFIVDDGGTIQSVHTTSDATGYPDDDVELSYITYEEAHKEYRLPCLLIHDGTNIKGYTGKATAYTSVGGTVMNFTAPSSNATGFRACTDGDYNYVICAEGQYLSVLTKGDLTTSTDTDLSSVFTGDQVTGKIVHYDASRLRPGPDRSLYYVATNYYPVSDNHEILVYNYTDCTGTPALTWGQYETGYDLANSERFSVLGGSNTETYFPAPAATAGNYKWFIFRVYEGDEQQFRTHTTTLQHRPKYGIIPHTSWKLYSVIRNTLRVKLLDTITDEEIQRNTDTVDFAAYMTRQPTATEGNIVEFDASGDAADSGVAADDVSTHIADTTSNPHDVEFADLSDAFSAYLVPDVLSADQTIPTDYQFSVHDTLEISSGVTLTINGTLIVED